MRNRPTPSAPAAAPACALFGSPTLASSRIRRPSDVAPSPLHTRLAPRRAAMRFSASCTAASLGAMSTVPAPPSSTTVVPSATLSAPEAATTAGTPSVRARIAVWLVGPPSVVTKPSTFSGSTVAVSAGARSRATRMNGWPGSGMPGIGTPSTAATIRSRTSSMSATRAPM